MHKEKMSLRLVESSMDFGIEEFLNPEYSRTYEMMSKFFDIGPFNLSGVSPTTHQRVVNLQISASWDHDTLIQMADLLDAMMEHVKPINEPKENPKDELLFHGKKYVSITTDNYPHGWVYALQSTDDFGTTWDLMVDKYGHPNIIAQKMSTLQLLMYMQQHGYTYHLVSFKYGFGFGGYND